METFLVVLTVICFVVLIFMLIKRLNAIFSMLIVGAVGLLIAAIATGDLSFVESSTGNPLFDVFVFCQSELVKSFSQTGITLIAVLGYVEFMNALKASDMFAMTVAKVVMRFKNQTAIIVIALFLSCIIKWVVPSAVTSFLLLYSTIYPILRACGVRRITAICVLGMGLAWSLGPGQPHTGMVYGTYVPESGITGPDFFINFELVYFVPVFIICAVVFILTTKFFEKREDEKPVEYINEEVLMDPNFDTKALGIPGWYGLLPILPLIVVIILGGQVIPGVRVGVVPIYLFFGLFVIIVEVIRKGGLAEAINSYQILLDGMGVCFARYASMVWAGAVFADAVSYMGGLNTIVSAVITPDTSQTALLIIGGIAVAVICGLTGQPNLGYFGLGPVIVAAANLIGADLIYVLTPMQAAATTTNILSVAAPVALVSAEKAGIPVTSYISRQAVPCIVTMMAIIICCAIFFMPAA